MNKEMRLRGLVVSYFGTITKLAEALEWSYSKAYRVITGVQEPTASDIRQLVEALHLTDAKDIVSVFSLS